MIHAFIVHFPIVFILLSGVLYIWSALKEDILHQEWAFKGHLLGVITMMLAVLSGNAAEQALVRTASIQPLVSQHEILGYTAAWGFALLALWYYLYSPKKGVWQILYIVLFVLLVGVMSYSAHLGGKMVYQQGAGVEPMKLILQEQIQKSKPINP